MFAFDFAAKGMKAKRKLAIKKRAKMPAHAVTKIFSEPARVRSEDLKATIYAYAAACGRDQETVLKKIRKMFGAQYKAGDLIPLGDFLRAMMGDRDEAMAHKLETDARLNELEIAKEEGRLHERAEIERTVWLNILLPLRTELELMPVKLAALIDAEQPERVRAILDEWKETTKKQIRGEPPRALEKAA